VVEPLLLTLALLSLAAQSAPSDGPSGTAESSGAPGPLGGPAATIDDAGPNAFGAPAPALTALERRAFAVGNAFFRDNWVEAPASTEGRDGLGPLFAARSCSACHLRDGRGRPPEDGEIAPTGLLLRLAGADGRTPHAVYGEQLQPDALGGFAPEGRIRIEREVRAGSYADGEPFELLAPRYSLDEPGYGAPGEIALGPRVAPQMIGLGLLAAIPAEAVLARADPDDADGDGISGRAPMLRVPGGADVLGRFGWKASQPSVRAQVELAFSRDLGLTTEAFPDETPTAAQREGRDVVSGGAPEVDAHKLERVAFYSSVLAVPAQRTPDDPRVRAGAARFDALGCAACHVPEWTTGDDAVVGAFARTTIRPYTDLLLHDLGPGLADELRVGVAEPAEWRTPPLWGIGLFEAVGGHTRYLHDGRARDLAEAILWHGGEAAAARERFRELDRGARDELLAFLRSL